MVFPAHAGMSLAALAIGEHGLRFPRSRGDEPSVQETARVEHEFSPLTRG